MLGGSAAPSAAELERWRLAELLPKLKAAEDGSRLVDIVHTHEQQAIVCAVAEAEAKLSLCNGAGHFTGELKEAMEAKQMPKSHITQRTSAEEP